MTQEYISIPQALGTSLLGFCIVFVVLVLLIVMIWIIKKAAGGAESSSAASDGDGGVRILEHSGVDDLTTATLMALTADKMKAPVDELRFISIREIDK